MRPRSLVGLTPTVTGPLGRPVARATAHCACARIAAKLSGGDVTGTALLETRRHAARLRARRGEGHRGRRPALGRRAGRRARAGCERRLDLSGEGYSPAALTGDADGKRHGPGARRGRRPDSTSSRRGRAAHGRIEPDSDGSGPRSADRRLYPLRTGSMCRSRPGAACWRSTRPRRRPATGVVDRQPRPARRRAGGTAGAAAGRASCRNSSTRLTGPADAPGAHAGTGRRRALARRTPLNRAVGRSQACGARGLALRAPCRPGRSGARRCRDSRRGPPPGRG